MERSDCKTVFCHLIDALPTTNAEHQYLTAKERLGAKTR